MAPKKLLQPKSQEAVSSSPVRGASISNENDRASPGLNMLAIAALSGVVNEDLEESLNNLFSGFKISDHNER